MKSFVWILAIVFAAGCTSSKKKTSQSEIPEPHMQHGWTVLTGPKKTIVGVNDEGSIKRGQKLFKKHCQGCHGEAAKGDGDVGTLLGLKPANLNAKSGTLPNYYLVIRINEGSENMPQWKDYLKSNEIWDISNYIQSLSSK